jgi:N-acetylated-alpha-linked acidic dipeptidase
MKRPLSAAAFIVVIVALAAPATLAQGTNQAVLPIAGFTSDKAAWERQYEALLKAISDPVVCQQHSVALTEHPTLVGSDWDWWNVQYSLQELRSYGLNPELKTYYVYMPSPRTVQVEMIAPTSYTAKTKENGWPWQKYFEDVVVGYNAYSPSGDITAELVYVNYGVPEDYAQLAKMGVDVSGKIAVARYGKVYRGVKNKVAHEHGAAGLILFSDPSDDGYTKGAVYPYGPWRPADGIQRGTLTYLFDYPGDPLTPGWAATETAPRLSPLDATNLPHAVPTTPLAYGEAEPLLQAIGGPAAPVDWQGGLPFTYHVGPGPAKVHLKLDIAYEIKPIWDIVVKIEGSKYPDQWVVLGAHRDGWTYGTSDSNSGYIVVMEIARALAQLQQQGWRPERTIVLGGWDGEEYGQLGSTEWAEELEQQLGKNAVVYLDLDSAGGGSYFTAAGVPSLDQLIYDVTKEVDEPRTPGTSVYDDWKARSGQPRPSVDRLGGGYDYEVWIDHLGVPTIQMVFDYIASGNYHSAYDDLYFLEHWGDPGYLHHAAMAKLAGTAALRLANADILPFQYSSYAGEVASYLETLNTEQVNQYGNVVVSFSREIAQASAWKQAALNLENKAGTILAANPFIPDTLAGMVAFINQRLLQQERDLTQAKGLPDRPWFRHMIYAPGVYTGYAVQTLPALQDLLAAGQGTKVHNYEALLHNSLTTATNTAATTANVAK